MNYFRSIFHSINSHAARAMNYIHTIIFGESSIINEETHNFFISNHTDECYRTYRPFLKHNAFGEGSPCICHDETHRWSLVIPFQKDIYKFIPEKLWYKKL